MYGVSQCEHFLVLVLPLESSSRKDLSKRFKYKYMYKGVQVTFDLYYVDGKCWFELNVIKNFLIKFPQQGEGWHKSKLSASMLAPVITQTLVPNTASQGKWNGNECVYARIQVWPSNVIRVKMKMSCTVLYFFNVFLTKFRCIKQRVKNRARFLVIVLYFIYIAFQFISNSRDNSDIWLSHK